MSYYTISDFKDLIFDGINTKLDDSVRKILGELSNKLIASDGDDTNYQKIKRGNNDDQIMKKGHRNKTQECDVNWNEIRNFKTTVIEKKEGIEKKINEIRIALNKFSVKNKEEQTVKIINLIDEVLNNETDGSDEKEVNDENLNKIIGFVFNIVSSNAFFSEIYAELYVTLMNKYNIFGSKIDNLIDNYKISYNEIKPVDANDDYDGYCGYVKENDKRKSMSSFMCYLTKYKALDSDTLLSIVDYIICLLPKVAEIENQTSVVDEYSDNLYIIITTAYELFRRHDKFKTVTVGELREISKLKKTDNVRYKSMSSRASFKIMDLLDYINKR